MLNAFVRKLVNYAALDDQEIKLLISSTDRPKRVPLRCDLIREGDEPGPTFVILEGWACRYKVLPDGSRQIMAMMLPGDFCDLHVGSLERMDHSVGTLTACQIVAVPREKMEALIVATPRLTHAFWRSQLIDAGVLRAWITSIGRRNAIERVAHLMLELYVRMRDIGMTNDYTCNMPLTQTVVADALGLTPIHINRVLRTLREEQAMTLGSKELIILDAERLARIAGFEDDYLHRRISKAA